MLGWPIVVKLIPALPVAVLLLQRWAAALAPSRSPRSLSRATTVTLGLALGVFLFTFAIPAACIGWSQNLHHLHTWSRKVVTSPDIGREVFVEVDNDSNQSFSNAAHLLAARIRGRATAGANSVIDQAAHRQWLAAVTAINTHRQADHVTAEWVRGVQVIVLALLMVAGLAAGLRNDILGQAATYGLACLATVLVSPVAWSHYYVLWLPSVLLVPPWLMRQGQLRAARAVAAVPLGLIWAHYLAKPWLGHFGFVGSGHADVVLGRRHPLDSDPFLYPASPYWNSGNDFPQSEPTPILHACELSSQQRKGRGGKEVCPRSPQVLARASSQLALALRTRQLRPETKKVEHLRHRDRFKECCEPTAPIASSRSSFFRHRIVYLQVGRSRHFIRQKCRFSPPSLGSGPSLPFVVLRRAWVVCLEEEPGYSGSSGGGDDRS